MAENFKFTSPPEAPVFKPTEAEFKNPIAYIAKIRPIAIKTGICKIQPPENWKPPFAVDIETFKFKARVQRLYELEAKSRVKFNFILKLSQFMKLQGREKLRIPNVLGRYLDLHQLHKFVTEEGGYEAVCIGRKWASIGNKLNYPGLKVTSALKTNYEKILLPYDVMLGTISSDETKKLLEVKQEKKQTISSRPPQVKRMRKSIVSDVDEIDYSANKELQKLQFFGPGPKAAVPRGKEEDSTDKPSTSSQDSVTDNESLGVKRKACVSTNIPTESKYKKLDEYICNVCKSGDQESLLLICDSSDCQECYHTFCLLPALNNVPKEQWTCPPCVIKTCSKPPEEFGFPESPNIYTLAEFGQRADQFKATYFNKPCHMVSCTEVEHEFWRILQAFNDDVVVEYGADIHSSKLGSGFPTPDNMSKLKNKKVVENAKKYASSPWNLNVLPVLHESMLRHVKANISGMKVPWCYVGMCFSSFCWHIEDHWSYSINYMHWGEPKTWYGVSGAEADKFEQAMQREAPELFEHAPDLLHHITTIMNPNILQREGVNIVRTDQRAGEFVVTFPRAYHAGFNQGFNFAEAVNFCPADWLSMGRGCIEHYAELHRPCVFSHEELLCTMAERAREEGITALDVNTRNKVQEELSLVSAYEKDCRSKLVQLGLCRTELVRFEDLADDDRVCDVCQTTCYVSALTCSCPTEGYKAVHKDRMVCLKHIHELCNCEWSNRVLKYRYTPGDLTRLVELLREQLSDFYVWEAGVSAILEGSNDLKHLVTPLKETKKETLLGGASLKTDYFVAKTELLKGLYAGYDVTPIFRQLESFVETADKLTELCGQIQAALDDQSDSMDAQIETDVLPAVLGGEPMKRTIHLNRLMGDEITFLVDRVVNYPLLGVGKPHITKLIELTARLSPWTEEACAALADAVVKDAAKVEALCHEAVSFKVILPEMGPLAKVGRGLNWCSQANLMFPDLRSLDDDESVRRSRRALKRAPLSKQEPSITKQPSTAEAENTKKQGGNSPTKRAAHLPSVGALEQLLAAGKEVAKTLAEEDSRLHAILARVHSRLGVLLTKMSRANKVRTEIVSMLEDGQFDYDDMISVSAEGQSLGMQIPELSQLKLACWTQWSGEAAAIKHSSGTFSTHIYSLTWFEKVFNLGVQLCNENVLLKTSNLKKDTENLKFIHNMVKLAHKLRAKVANEFLLNSASDPLAAAADTRLLQVLLPRIFGDEIATKNLVSQFIDSADNVDTDQLMGDAPIDENFYQESIQLENKSFVKLRGETTPPKRSSLTCCLCWTALDQSQASEKYPQFCPQCSRSRRPSLSTLINLNKKLTQLPLRTYEAAALQGLTRRVLLWLEGLEAIVRGNPHNLWPLIQQMDDVPVPIREASTSSSDLSCCPVLEAIECDVQGTLETCLKDGLLMEVDLGDYWRFIDRLLNAMEAQNSVLQPSKSQNLNSSNVSSSSSSVIVAEPFITTENTVPSVSAQLPGDPSVAKLIPVSVVETSESSAHLSKSLISDSLVVTINSTANNHPTTSTVATSSPILVDDAPISTDLCNDQASDGSANFTSNQDDMDTSVNMIKTVSTDTTCPANSESIVDNCSLLDTTSMKSSKLIV